MRGASNNFRGGTALALVLVILSFAAPIHATDSDPYEPPQARIGPPGGVSSQARIGPPGGEPTAKTPVGAIDLFLAWVRARIGLLNE